MQCASFVAEEDPGIAFPKQRIHPRSVKLFHLIFSGGVYLAEDEGQGPHDFTICFHPTPRTRTFPNDALTGRL